MRDGAFACRGQHGARTLHLIDLDSAIGGTPPRPCCGSRIADFIRAYRVGTPLHPADDAFIMGIDALPEASRESAFLLRRLPGGEGLAYGACLNLYDRTIVASADNRWQHVVETLVGRGGEVLVASEPTNRCPELDGAATGLLDVRLSRPAHRCAATRKWGLVGR